MIGRSFFTPELLPWRRRYRQMIAAVLLYLSVGLASTAAAISDREGLLIATMGRAALAVGAAFLPAALIGALFATTSQLGSASAAPDRRLWARATNQLRSTADWVAKMLIGALLALQTFAPRVLWSFLQLFGVDGSGVDGLRTGGLVVLYFGAGGFLLGYLIARRRTLELDRPQLLEDGLQLAMRLPANGGHWKGLTVSQSEAIEIVAQTPSDLLRTDAELRGWARVQLMFGDGTKALEAFTRLAARSDDAESQAELEFARNRVEPPKPPEALPAPSAEIASDPRITIDTPPAPEATSASDPSSGVATTTPLVLPSEAVARVYEALYEPEPDGFRKAIAIGERFADKIQSAALLVYLACAYGQEHAWLRKNAPDPVREQEVANKALFCVQQAIDLDATWRAPLRSFWSPNSPGEDNDLVSLHDDSRFGAILDPEGFQRAAAAASAGASFNGRIAIWISNKDGSELPRNDSRLHVVEPGIELRLVAQFNPETILSSAVVADIRLDGVSRSIVDFTLRPDSTDIEGFAPNSLTFDVPTDTPSMQPDFLFAAPTERATYEIWVYVTQAGRSAQLVRIPIVVL